MSIRNVIRRPGTTALVIGGLMVGTAIISASFVVGDTMDNMITDQVTKGMGQVDFELQTDNVGTCGLLQLDRDRTPDNEHQLHAARPGCGHSHPRLDAVGGLKDTAVLAIGGTIGLDSNTVSDFGGLVDQNGARIDIVADDRYDHPQSEGGGGPQCPGRRPIVVYSPNIVDKNDLIQLHDRDRGSIVTADVGRVQFEFQCVHEP